MEIKLSEEERRELEVLLLKAELWNRDAMRCVSEHMRLLQTFNERASEIAKKSGFNDCNGKIKPVFDSSFGLVRLEIDEEIDEK